jgi:NitT/TauT family transport system substrate-binding protein
MAYQIDRRQFLQVSMAVPTAPPRKIRAGVTPYPTMSSFYLAHELGYFTDAGLDVEIEPFNASFQIVPLLAAGKIDVTFAAQSPALINAIARGARLRIVAAREIFSPTCGDSGHIYGRRDRFPHGLGDLTSLKGKRVAFGRRAAINEFVLDMILRYAGLRSADIQAVEIARTESIAALLAGKVDAVVIGTQFDSALAGMSSQLVTGLGVAQIFPNSQYSYMVFGKNLIDGPPEIGARFLRAYFRGSQDFLQGKTPRFLEDYARSNNIDFKQLRDACRTSITADGKFDAESLPRFVSWAVEKGYCESSVKGLELTDTRFLMMR